MPRVARLDAVGVLQHVMARGIEKRDIFIDDRDRRDFLQRLSELLLKTETACLAWCLMNNHVHLLLRPQKTKLSFFMRRLLTGYAVSFNLRHDRVGHLFQNRYKSIVCEEEPYLLELVRYIHLNPVRSGLITCEKDLRKYPWTGHAVLMGVAELAGQVTSDILRRFGNDLVEARERYRSFLIDALEAGRVDTFSCGDVVTTPFMMPGRRGEEARDSRILGSGDFVEQLWTDRTQEVPQPRMTLPCLLQEVASLYDVDVAELRHPNKRPPIPEARAVICYLGVRELGYTGVALSSVLHITSAGVTIAAKRGEVIAKGDICQMLLLKIRILKS